MASGPQVSLALGVGYLLGRRRKRKMMIMLGTAALTGVSTGPAGQLLKRGVKTAAGNLGSAETLGKISPQVGEIAGLIQGDLVQAGKAAATAAVSSRLDSLTGQLQERAEELRNPAAAATGAVGGAAEAAGGAAGTAARGAGSTARGATGTAARRATGSAGRGGTGSTARGATGNAARGTAGTAARRGASSTARGATDGERSPGAGRRTAVQAGSPARARRRPAEETGSGPPARRAARPASQGR
jgi:hypothetical protein